MEKFLTITPVKPIGGLVVGKNYFYKCSSAGLTDDQCYIEFLNLTNPIGSLLNSLPTGNQVNCSEYNELTEPPITTRPITTTPVTTQPPVTTSPGTTNPGGTTTTPPPTTSSCRLTISSVSYPIAEQPHLRSVNLSNQFIGIRSYRITFKTSGGVQISSRLVENVDTTTYPYLLFNETNDGMVSNGNYTVEVYDLNNATCVATKLFSITTYGSSTTTPPATTIPNGSTTQGPSTTIPSGTGSYYPTDEDIEANEFYPERYFTYKDYSKQGSPFTNAFWEADPGRRVDRYLDTYFGYGAQAGLDPGNSGEPTENDALPLKFLGRKKAQVELSQDGTSQCIGYPGLQHPDAETNGVGNTYQLTAGGTITTWIGQASFNYLRASIDGVGGANSNYSYTRFDIEHAPLDNFLHWIGGRNLWENGKYRHSINGGTNPQYMNMSDAEWYEMFMVHVTKIVAKLYFNTRRDLLNQGVALKDIWIVCYGAWGDRGQTGLWDRVVEINGQTMPTIRSMSLEHPGDMIVGHYAYKLIGGGDQQWLALDLATAPMKNTVVNKKPTRFRVIQVNDINSSIPKVRGRLEDSEGNIAKDPNGGVAKISIAYHQPGQSGIVTETSQLFLRSENDQIPDATFDLPTTVDLTWWKLHSNYEYLQDNAIARFLVRSHQDKPLSPTGYSVAQVYPYTVQECCIMYGTCFGGNDGSQGQCEDNSSVSVSARTFTALAFFRYVERVNTALWQRNPGRNQSTTGGTRFWKGNVGYFSKFNTYQALQRFSEYYDLMGEDDNRYSVSFQMSYNGGASYMNHNDYLNTMWNGNVDIKAGAVKIIWNASKNQGLIVGTPIYTDNINVTIKYTINGMEYVKNLALSKSLKDGMYFERI